MRTSFANGCQSPRSPFSETARNRSAPNTDGPKLFSGRKRTKHRLGVFQNQGTIRRLRETSAEPSSVATSIFSERGKIVGTSLLKKNEICPSCGRSSGLPRRITEGVGPDCTLRLSSVTRGRGGSTTVSRSSTRPSLRATCANSFWLGFSAAAVAAFEADKRNSSFPSVRERLRGSKVDAYQDRDQQRRLVVCRSTRLADRRRSKRSGPGARLRNTSSEEFHPACSVQIAPPGSALARPIHLSAELSLRVHPASTASRSSSTASRADLSS